MRDTDSIPKSRTRASLTVQCPAPALDAACSHAAHVADAAMALAQARHDREYAALALDALALAIELHGLNTRSAVLATDGSEGAA